MKVDAAGVLMNLAAEGSTCTQQVWKAAVWHMPQYIWDLVDQVDQV